MQKSAYTPDEIASLFKIAKNTVYELIKRGELQAFKVGNKMRISQEEVERYMAAMRTAPAKKARSHSNLPSLAFTLQLAGSHDFLVEKLVSYVAEENACITLSPSYIGSLEGLMMLYRGAADIAAVHLLDPSSQEYNLPFIRQLFIHEKITVIRLASRKQGLIVPKVNRKNIVNFHDLTRNNVTFVNRQKGSGTRFLFDSFLSTSGISPKEIRGYGKEEWNHLSAASHICSGQADVTFGASFAASRLDLGFIPMATEQFDLVFRWTSENETALMHLLDLLQVTTFKEHALACDGYDAAKLGEIIYQSF
ncbi:helix-turn-helix transcriptional regulator [Bacillus massilinigeriensis]|uniref:helix-turn-helix transcriptional regulator n=1 Tax=Bacillus mediterraneensis TaxID=1805474 RepID=UPI0008F95F32|nr:helix-turn-helix transcriptional regulator [Bacillus mediterraneensis]